MTSKRARELRQLLNWINFGCLCLGAKKPDIDPMTADESQYVMDVWNTMSGNTSFDDALAKISYRRNEVSG
jgi:hypothetical protein